MTKLLTVREVATLANRSRTSVHRDISDGKLPTVHKVPGYKGAYLIDEAAALEAYSVEARTA